MSRAEVFNKVETGAVSKALLYAFFALLSAGLFMIATRHGIGILPDSTRYMQISPIPFDAPLYSWLLQLGSLIGVGHDAAAYSFGLLLYICNTLVLIYLFNIVMERKLRYVILAAFLVTLAPQFVRAHIVAMSEPLFLLLILAAIILVTAYIERQDIRLLVLAGITLGLCMLTRFTAAPFALTLATVLLISNVNSRTAHRIYNVALLAFVSGSIFALWAVGSKILIGRSTGRSLALHGNPDLDRWFSGLDSLSAFMLPTAIPSLIRYPLTLLLPFLVLFLTVQACRRIARKRPAPKDALSAIFGLAAFFYLAFMILAVNIEANLPINGRYLFPVYIGFIVVIFSALARNDRRLSRAEGLMLYLAVAVVIVGHTVRTASLVREAYLNGTGYEGPKWRGSPIISAVTQLPRDATIFSNAPDAISYLTARKTKLIPTKFERRTGVEDSGRPYKVQIEELASIGRRGNTYVVFVDGVDWRFYLAPENELQKDAALVLAQTKADGRIYAW